MANLCNFADWDRNIISVSQVKGNGGGLDTVFDITVRGLGGRPSVLRYTTVEYDEYSNFLVKGKNTIFTSIDRVTVVPTATGCDVTYDAILTANWIVAPMNLVLGAVFKKVGDSATKGLRKVLAAQ
ncbi:MAG: hypothetical protein RIR69_923 [Actinomycetota bacterium]|jgi:hypothetical protein